MEPPDQYNGALHPQQEMRTGDSAIVGPYESASPAPFHLVAVPMRRARGAVALRIDPIGSTALPGLAAKPVIDI